MEEITGELRALNVQIRGHLRVAPNAFWIRFEAETSAGAFEGVAGGETGAQICRWSWLSSSRVPRVGLCKGRRFRVPFPDVQQARPHMRCIAPLNALRALIASSSSVGAVAFFFLGFSFFLGEAAGGRCEAPRGGFSTFAGADSAFSLSSTAFIKRTQEAWVFARRS